MSERTPGPWFDGFCHWGRSDVYAKGGDGSHLINGKPVTYVARDMQPDDARMAAAAPDLYEALKPFARLAEDDVLQIIAANLAPLVSFLTFTDADGKEVARVTLDDLHKARAALLRAQASEQSGG